MKIPKNSSLMRFRDGRLFARAGRRIAGALALAALLGAGSALAQPANDNFANSTVVSGLPVNTTGNNTGATRETGEPNSVQFESNREPTGGTSIWWRWTAPQSGAVVIATGRPLVDRSEGDFDTQLGVYTGSAVNALTEIASNEDAAHPITGAPNYLGGGRSEVRFNAVSGTIYRIMVDGWQGAMGVTQLHIYAPDGGGGGDTVTITVSASPIGGGTATGGGTVAQNSSVTVTATPNTGFTFSNWTEGATVVSTDANFTFTASANRTLVANFAQTGGGGTNFVISASASPANGGTVSGGGSFAQGAQVTLTAAPASGFQFVRWTEGGTQISTSSTLTFTASANRTLVAVFQQSGTPGTPTAPSIVTQPADQNITAGSTATFTVNASGTAPLRYQWWHNGRAIANATNATLQATSAGNYQVVVSNAQGSVTSRVARLNVGAGTPAPGDRPVIATQPADQTLSGQPVTLSVQATGAAPLSYQWWHNGGAIPGATQSSLQVTAAGNYQVVVSNPAGAVNSRVAVVSGTSAGPGPGPAPSGPVIVVQPQDQTIGVGQTTVLSVQATGSNLTYQWWHNGAPVAGTSSTLQVSAPGNYQVVVSNAAGAVNSRVATVTVAAVAPGFAPPALAGRTFTLVGADTESTTFNFTSATSVLIEGDSQPFAYSYLRTGANTGVVTITTQSDIAMLSLIFTEANAGTFGYVATSNGMLVDHDRGSFSF